MALSPEQLEEFEALGEAWIDWYAGHRAITALVAEVRRLQAERPHAPDCPHNYVKPEGPCTCGQEEWRGLDETRRGMDV